MSLMISYPKLPYEIIKHVCQYISLDILALPKFENIHPCIDEIVTEYVQSKVLCNINIDCILMNSRYKLLVLNEIKQIANKYATQFKSFADSYNSQHVENISETRSIGLVLNFDFEYNSLLFDRDGPKKTYSACIYFIFNKINIVCSAAYKINSSNVALHIINYTHEQLSHYIFEYLNNAIDSNNYNYNVKMTGCNIMCCSSIYDNDFGDVLMKLY